MDETLPEATDVVLSEDFFLDPLSRAGNKRDLLQQALEETTQPVEFNDEGKIGQLNCSTGDGECLNASENADGTVAMTEVVPSSKGSSSNVVDAQNDRALSEEQLRHIAGFLQRQSCSSKNNGGMVYHAPTNTRIVYQVLYPSGLSAEDEQKMALPETTSSGSQSSKPKPRRASWGRKFGETEEKKDGPRLTRQEKEAKKRQRLRTRSGRVSKPPSYMVRDYKRLHHLDFDEEPFDDSDGGYSDFQFDANDATATEIHDRAPPLGSLNRYGRIYERVCELFISLVVSEMQLKSKNYGCSSCQKAYIGPAGLSRHLKLNPEHGPREESPDTESCLPDLRSSNKQVVQRDEIAAVGRTPLQNLEKANAGRNRARLRALIKRCRDDEILEMLTPRLMKTMSTWQFLLRKCRVGSCHDLRLVQNELGNVVKEAEKMARNWFVPNRFANPPDGRNGNHRLDLTDRRAARAMGISTGAYEVKGDLKLE